MKKIFLLGVVTFAAVFFWLNTRNSPVLLKEESMEQVGVEAKHFSPSKDWKARTPAKMKAPSKDGASDAAPLVSGEKKMSSDGSYVAQLRDVDYVVASSLLGSSDSFISTYGRELFKVDSRQFKRVTVEEKDSGLGLQKVSYEQRIGDVLVHGSYISLVYEKQSLFQVQARIATEEVQNAAPALESRIAKDEAMEYVWTDLKEESVQYEKENLREAILDAGEFRYYLDDYGHGHRLTLVYRFVAAPEKGVAYEYIVDAERGKRNGIALKNDLIIR